MVIKQKCVNYHKNYKIIDVLMDGVSKAGFGGALSTAVILGWLGYLYYRNKSDGQKKYSASREDKSESSLKNDKFLKKEEYVVVTAETTLRHLECLLKRANLDNPESGWFNCVQNILEMLSMLDVVPPAHRGGIRDQVGIFLTNANNLLNKEIPDKNIGCVARAYTNVVTSIFIQKFTSDLEKPWETCYYLYHNALALLFQNHMTKHAGDVILDLISCSCRYLIESDTKKVLELVRNYVALVGEKPANEFIYLDLAQPLVLCGEYEKAIQVYQSLALNTLKLPFRNKKILFRPVSSNLLYAISLLETQNEKEAYKVLSLLFAYLHKAVKQHGARPILAIINRNRLIINSINSFDIWIKVTEFQQQIMKIDNESFEEREHVQMEFLKAVHLTHAKKYYEALGTLNKIAAQASRVFSITEAFFQHNTLKAWLMYNTAIISFDQNKNQLLHSAIRLFEFSFEILVKLGDYESERIIFIINSIQAVVSYLPEDDLFYKKYSSFPRITQAKKVSEFPMILVMPFWGLEVDFQV